MPEYLAPGVYVEEVDTGPKPIEGVSTSTSGMVGVTRRGPVNKPVLVTNFGEYRRFFGDFLLREPYRDRRWLPYAVDGFFANGGRRAYIVRVAKITRAPGEPVDVNLAAVAHAILPDRSNAVRRTLAKAVRAGEQEIDLSYWAGLSVGNVLQLGDGIEAEYVQITEFTSRIRINAPLTRDHRAGVTVMQVSASLTTLARASANSVGAQSIHVADRNAAGLVVNAWVQIEDENNTEFVRLGTGAATVGAGGIDVTPTLRFTHAAGRNVRVVTLPGVVTGALGASANAGDTAIQLNAAAASALAKGDWIQIHGNSGQEQVQADFVRIMSAIPAAAPFSVTVAPALRFPHDNNAEIHKATITLGAATTLIAPTSIRLLGAAGLVANAVVMIEDGNNTEFVQLSADPDANLDAALTSPLRFPHTQGRNIRSVTLPATTTTLTAAASQDAMTITVADRANLTQGTVVELLDGTQTEYAEVATSGAGAGNVTLLRPLRFPHPTGTPVRALQGTLRIIAGPSQPDPSLYPEVGVWGNEICIQMESSCIVRAEVTQPVSASDPALTLSTVRGIESGSVVRLPGNHYRTVTLVQGNRIFLQGGVPADITAADILATGNNVWRKQVMTCEFTMRISYAGIDEVFEDLSMDLRHSRYFVDIVNEASRLVHVETIASGTASPLNQPLTTSGWYLGGGDDLLTSIGADVYVGIDAVDADRRTGLFSLLNCTDVSIVAIPGQTDPTIHLALITHAERARYRFAVLDSEENADLDRVQSQRSLFDSKYTALYYPWIQIFDPLEKQLVFAPPAGHMIGIYARSDIERGVHKAPANETVSQVRALQATITQGQQDILNPNGINAIRAFPGRGIRVWGARTLSSDPDWKYINVRRLFIFVEHSIDRGTQWVVFEPNNEALWERVKRVVSGFLTQVWRDGALMGKTKEEAFFVKCDRTTMTQNDIDNGRLIVQVGIAPVKPAEFVIFRIGQWVGGSELEEG